MGNLTHTHSVKCTNILNLASKLKPVMVGSEMEAQSSLSPLEATAWSPGKGH